MRIAILSWADATSPFGGFTRPFWLGEELGRLGHQVVHFCPVPPFDFDSSVAYVPLVESTDGRRSSVTRRAFETHLELLRYRPNLLYVHQTSQVGFLALRTLRLFPTVLDVHGSSVQEKRARNRPIHNARLREAVLLALASSIVAASDELKEFLVSEYRIRPSRLNVVPNGVPDHILNAPRRGQAWRAELRIRDNRTLALHVAPPTFEANELSMGFLGRIVLTARQEGVDVRFAVCGRSQAPDGVIPLGIVDDYVGLLDAVNVALLPYPPEAVCGGARNKALEFMGRGKAVVSTIEGMRGIPEARPWVHYVPAETPREFAEAIHLLSQDSGLRARLQTASRELAARYLWSVQARKLAELFHEEA